MVDTIIRNKKVVFIIIICVLILFGLDYYFNFFSKLITKDNKDELFSFIETVIAFSSITTAFLFFGVSFIPLISDDNKIMKVFRNKEKNYEEFIVCAIMFLLVSMISILIYILFLISVPFIKWLFFLMFVLLGSSMVNMWILFYDLLKDISDKIKN